MNEIAQLPACNLSGAVKSTLLRVLGMRDHGWTNCKLQNRARLQKSKLYLTAFLFLSALTRSEAQEPVGTFPFERAGQLILVQASVDKHPPVLFVVDSGAPHSVLDPKFATELRLKTKSAPPTSGTGTGNVARSYGSPIAMRLHDVEIDVPQPWIIDLSEVPIPKATRGLVGAELFTRYVVRMDPLRSTFAVFDPASYIYHGDGTAIPLILENNRLYLSAELEVSAGHSVTHRLRIDTGSEDSVNDAVVRQAADVRSTNLGNGLGENFKSYSGIFASVKIGPYSIKHVWGPGGPNPSIGMELLRRFIITFDAPHGKMYLEPTLALAEPVPTPPAEG